MQSAQIMAGYSLGGADLLRRAMGKKIASEMDAQRSVFVNGAAKNDIDAKKANEIFDLIDKFSGYGFNKSHSVAYAYVSYQTAWLKSHYPAAFMASVLSRMMDDTDRVSFTVGEVRAMSLLVKGPNVNESLYEFSIQDTNTLTYGLGAIKGVGEAVVDILVAEREANGIYQDLFDFCMRIEKRALNKRALEALIYSGALDEFGVDRAVLIKTYPSAMRQAEQQQNDRSSGQSALFSEAQGCQEYDAHYQSVPPFSFRQTLQFEKSVLGYYFYQHPTDEYKEDIKIFSATLPKDLTFRNNKEVRVLALVSDVYYRTTRKGSQMASIVLEDGQQTLNAVIFSKVLETEGVSEQLSVDAIVIASGTIEKDDYRDGWQLIINTIENIDTVKQKYARSVNISLAPQHTPLFQQLATLLQQTQGQCPVKLHYQTPHATGTMQLNNTYAVTPNQQLTEIIDTLLSTNASHIKYTR